ncbi:WD repeat-containing protein 6 [Yamadazyma tenuis]|uniref:WD40 repeat-like protein n=1 Tax=Candida tenuis (strain ATCC 10573 / BCRC 21748 / CBS 615 / JCM 9827 / NBRC 10315 / NRRL Y-1498 / VKM Y-70) TaxID=590646 RepID=G3B1N8_CANTC|nr:WD40 repeat-like protein [Yamadazyma tenuis ATCC 10573]EGV64493.1 WD40 repeat-like protein [Yamadazyma tenuis ATCC 10573]WEJ97255.1 WD repeat-containing protein 6 [Yamadazyma tenuis]
MIEGFNTVSSVNEDYFTSLSHYGPVTALRFYQHYILCGYGPVLKLFKIEKNECSLVNSQQVFKRNKIHSISVTSDGSKVIIAGARSFSVIEFSEKNWQFVEKAVNEWITCVEFLNPQTALILTSHNIVYKVDVSDMVLFKFRLQERIDCNEKSILYSGSIRVGDGKVIIAAGTVMDGVIIWDMNSSKILHRLNDHKGSIFGVKVNSSLKHIISCSDDRSVKLYDFESGKFLAEGWGHGARIWNLEFYKQSESLRIISSGEDCTVRVWQYEEGSDRLKQLEVIDDCHLGKHVWSCDVDDVQNNMIVTGGADGSVRLHDLQEVDNLADCYSIESISKNFGVVFDKSEVIKNIAEMDNLDYLFALTSHGKLLCLDQSVLCWKVVELEENECEKFCGFAIMKSIPSVNTLVISSIFGDTLVMDFNSSSIQPLNKTWFSGPSGNKVNSLLITEDPAHKNFYLLSDCPNTKIPFQVRHFRECDGRLKFVEEIRLDQPNQPKFTSTCMIYDSINHWLIVYSRFTSIMIYDLNTKQGKLFRKICDGDTITSASVIENKPGSIHCLAVVRDGVYLYIKFTKSAEFEIEITHENKLTRGFIEGGFIKNKDLYLYGFRSNYFYVWNETKQLEVAKELCGGSHRLWEVYFPGKKDIKYRFAYIHKSKLYIKTFNNFLSDDSCSVINSGTHGREIRDIAISPLANDDNTKYIMTASEDTVVRLGRLHSNGDIKYNWCLNEHVSGMQRIGFLNHQFVASSAAMEEFFIWKISCLEDGTPLIKKYSSLKPESDFPDLRVMDFDSCETETGFIISTVYSDSGIKIWDFNVNTKVFTLLSKGFYTTCCLLQVKFLRFNDELHLLTTATDGHIAIWRIENSQKELGNPIIRQQLHQNSIKGVILDTVHVNLHRLVTGGDDNALVLSTLTFRNGKIEWSSQSFVEDAASSTITTMAYGGDQKVIVTSVDQINRMWDYSSGSLECVSAKYTTVADTGCSHTTVLEDQNMLVVGGAGLSVWTW